jgi:hypothetical protein
MTIDSTASRPPSCGAHRRDHAATLLEALEDAVARLGWWWPQFDAAILTDRPTILARDGQGRLHAEHGPALTWADGYTLHAVHGVRVPVHVVQAPQTISVDW